MCPCVDLFINLDDFPCFVDNDCHATAYTIGLVRCTPKQANVAPCIDEQRKIQAVLFSELFVRFSILYANPKNLCIVVGKFARLIPERADFCRSATGEIFRVKCKEDVLFPAEVTELIRFAILVIGDEIRCQLSDLDFVWNAFVNQLDEICAVCLDIHASINCTDISRFVDNEGRAVRHIELFHNAAVDFAVSKVYSGEQRKAKSLLFLKLLVRFYVIDANAQNNCIGGLDIAQLIPE